MQLQRSFQTIPRDAKCRIARCKVALRKRTALAVLPGRQSSKDFLAIDVEFATFERQSQRHAYAAEVCVVDISGEVVLHRHCRPSPNLAASQWRGGVSYKLIGQASPISEVAVALQDLIAGKVLVGHGLKNDLIALGIEHPLSSMRDTSNYAKFQRRDGSTHSLKKLAKQWLNKDIQPKSKSHSAKPTICLENFAVTKAQSRKCKVADSQREFGNRRWEPLEGPSEDSPALCREDAQTVMELYAQCILTDPSQMLSEQEMIDAYLYSLQVERTN